MWGIAGQLENPESFSLWRPLLLSALGGVFVYFGWEALSTMKTDLESRPGLIGSLLRTALWTAFVAAGLVFVTEQPFSPLALTSGFVTFLALDYFLLSKRGTKPPEPPS